MDNTSTIFPEFDTGLYRAYSRRILTGTIITFIYSGLELLSAFFLFSFAQTFNGMSLSVAAWTSLAYGIALLVLALWSVKTPFMPLLIATIIAAGTLSLQLPGRIQIMNSMNFVKNGSAIAFQVTLVCFLGRSCYFARKRKKLAKPLDNVSI